MRYLFIVFLFVSTACLLMSNQWGAEDEYSPYSCSTKKFPNGGPGPFMDCSTVNPLVDILCAGCHGQNPVTDANNNILSYGNIVDGSTMNVFKVLDGTTQITQYIPGHEYTIELNMSTPAVRKGFDVTICASTGDDGSFTQILTEPGVQVYNDLGYLLATHTNNTGTDLWRWKWVAPSVNPGPLTFDILTLKDNSPISPNDSLFVSHVQLSPLPASIDLHSQVNNSMQLWVDNANQKLILNFDEAMDSPLNLEIFNYAGQCVLAQKIEQLDGNTKMISLPSSKESGIYFVRFSNDQGKSFSRKIFLFADH